LKVDYLIVGLGLAGTLLANELIRKNKSVVVFNHPDQPKASEVAAGLINPVVFRRMNKSWLVDHAFPQMESTYRQLEDLLQDQFYYPGKMMRILDNDGTEFWKEKALANNLEFYMNIEPDFNFRNKNIKASFGYGCINKSGRLDLQKLISLFSKFLNQQGYIRNEKLDFNQLNSNADSVSYKDVIANKIIFCEGAAASENPYFQKLKFKSSKGEVLELKIPDFELKEIVSGEVFLIPIGDDRYKVGATYSWDKLDWEDTNSARKELLGKLKNITKMKFDVLNQKAGIRPTMNDRKPVIGLLPENPQIGIFNGLGSKGALLGPYFAKQFADYLIGDSRNIHQEVNISRYFKKTGICFIR
jgi:glycine/D-amino acid oxidase-like deaminating enzyme